MGEAKRRKAQDPNWGAGWLEHAYKKIRKELVRDIAGSDARKAFAVQAIESDHVLACFCDEAFTYWAVADPESDKPCQFGKTAKEFFKKNKSDKTVLVSFMSPEIPGAFVFAIDKDEIFGAIA